MEELNSTFSNLSDSHTKGVAIKGVHYKIIRADKYSIYAKKVKKNFKVSSFCTHSFFYFIFYPINKVFTSFVLWTQSSSGSRTIRKSNIFDIGRLIVDISNSYSVLHKIRRTFLIKEVIYPQKLKCEWASWVDRDGTEINDFWRKGLVSLNVK